MKLRLVTVFLILLVMLIPIEQGMSQTSDDEFAWQIAFMYIADGYLSGQNSSMSLTIYRDHIQAQYNDLIDEVRNGWDTYSKSVIDDLTVQRDQEMKRFDQSIRNASATEQANPNVNINLIHQVIMDGAAAVSLDSPPNLNPAIISYANEIRDSQVQQHTAHAFYGHVANGVKDGAAVINAVNPGKYNFGAGLPPSPVGSDQPGVHPPGSDPPPAGSDDALPPNIHKPVRFTNHGAVGVTVVVESYIPNPQVQPAPRSDASTVVMPITNSSAYLSLPQGTYTFCYYWELEGDADGDGYFDYAHKVTGEMSLNQNSPDEVALALSMGLSPETNSSPNGRCGEGGDISADGLTPQELANQGTHTYLAICTDGENNVSIAVSIQFSQGGVSTISDGETIFFNKVSPNIYTVTDDLELFLWRLTFTDSGFTLHAEDAGDELDCVYTRQ